MTTKTTPQRKRMNATKRADAILSKMVRERFGPCFAAGFRFDCGGSWQCCHIIRRRYYALRFREENVVKMCAAHHTWFSFHDLEWQDYVNEVACSEDSEIGLYDWLHRRALTEPSEKSVDALVRLRALSEEI